MSFLTPLAALGGLLAIPILLLYMLRLRRRDVVVSSNLLWQQVIQDAEANTPWQRLRRNLLMLLQLLLLGLLVLAAMRPAQEIATVTASKTVILLDASASMNAIDTDEGSRFAAAQAQALNLVNQLNNDDQVSVIRVAENAEILIGYSDDFRAVQAAIQAAEVGQGRGDWQTALTLAAAGADSAQQFSMIILSDGGIVDSGQLPQNIPAPVYMPIGTSSANVAITALASRQLPNRPPQLFAQVQNFDRVAKDISLLIRLDGELWQSTSQTVSAASSRSFIFDVDVPFTTMSAELVFDDGVRDDLINDNHAYAVASERITRRVLLLNAQNNIFLDEVLRGVSDVQIFRGDINSATLPGSPYDLYIFNNYLPNRLPDADMLIINPPTSSDLFRLGAVNNETRRLRIVARDHPIAAFLSLEAVNLQRFREVHDLDWATPIARGDGGAILYAGDIDGRQVALLPFDLLDSDLPLQIAFPILMANILDWTAPNNVLSDGTAFAVGDGITIKPPLGTTQVQVTLPDGSQQHFDVDRAELTFVETTQTGLYRVEMLNDETVTTMQVFAVNTFGAIESDIRPRSASALDLGGNAQADYATERRSYREWWQWLLVAGLLVLLAEWMLSYRRLRVPTDNDHVLSRTTARQ